VVMNSNPVIQCSSIEPNIDLSLLPATNQEAQERSNCNVLLKVRIQSTTGKSFQTSK
jgi:hypothetical protein